MMADTHMDNNFQRAGSTSNAAEGSKFEKYAEKWFRGKGIELQRDYGVEVGFSKKKERKFDLGSCKPPILVECKSHKWTGGDNVPSAKITVWNESMYYFHLAPSVFRKVLFVLLDKSKKSGESLAEYYVRNHSHLIPDDVEIWEYNEPNKTAEPCHRARVRRYRLNGLDSTGPCQGLSHSPGTA